MSIQTVNYKAWTAAIAAAEEFAERAREALAATKLEDRQTEVRHKFIRDRADGPLPPYPNEHAAMLRASAKRSSMDLTRALVHIRRQPHG